MKSKLFILSTLLAVFGLSACETMEGFGRDVETAGEAITDTAQDAKN